MRHVMDGPNTCYSLLQLSKLTDSIQSSHLFPSLQKKGLGTRGAKKMLPKGHETELRCYTNSIAILNNVQIQLQV